VRGHHTVGHHRIGASGGDHLGERQMLLGHRRSRPVRRGFDGDRSPLIEVVNRDREVPLPSASSDDGGSVTVANEDLEPFGSLTQGEGDHRSKRTMGPVVESRPEGVVSHEPGATRHIGDGEIGVISSEVGDDCPQRQTEELLATVGGGGVHRSGVTSCRGGRSAC